ncbi:MAG: copper chaperone [Alphaproteobacteria bacterium]|nr:MAG: copper chaperone [Alphaproteobacteria bacterium]
MIRLSVPDMSCNHCVATIEKALTELDPAAEVKCDLGDRTVVVSTAAPTDRILKALSEAGYEARPA